MILESILLFLNILCFVMVLYFFFRTAKLADDMERGHSDVQKITTRMDYFETEFSEKFDNYVRKNGSRLSMRKRREDDVPEDSNTTPVLVPV